MTRTEDLWPDMPATIAPMRTAPARGAIEGPEWATELLWEGVRAIVYCRDGGIRIEGRGGEDLTELFPELEGLGRVPRAQGAVFDGEIVTFDERGLLQVDEVRQRRRPSPDRGLPPALRGYVAVLVIFDLLWDRGKDLRSRPYRERRLVLRGMELGGPTWRVPDYLVGEVGPTAAAAADQGLPGLVVKRLDSAYVSGPERTGDWLTVRSRPRHEFVVAGIRPGDAETSTRPALLIGSWTHVEGEGEKFAFAGIVEDGLDRAELESLSADAERFVRSDPPFRAGDRPFDPTGFAYVSPVRVVEVEFERVDEAGRLTGARYFGMRRNRDPGDVRRPGETREAS